MYSPEIQILNPNPLSPYEHANRETLCDAASDRRGPLKFPDVMIPV